MDDPKKILSLLTLEEKADLCSGLDSWHTRPVKRLGVPAAMMSDGPHGLRKMEGDIGVSGLKKSISAVCFPASCALASSFDQRLAERVGGVLGRECAAENVAMLLGPGLNIKRSPLCGRNFEYYSEDPYLAGKLGAAIVRGIQGAGASACVKHFAANSQETRRMSSDSVMDERTLREIYLTAFETVVKEGAPHAVMCAYNSLNGAFCSENRHLLTEILRELWGFAGMVVTDWGASKDPAAGVRAGLDLIMPGGSPCYSRLLVKAVKSGELDESELDRSVLNVLNFVGRAASRKQPAVPFDREADLAEAVSAAKQCAVLLKNDRGVLPLRKDSKVVFIGEFARAPRYQGSGSSHINSARVTDALSSAKGLDVSFAQGCLADGSTNDSLIAQAVAAARGADAAVLFVGLPDEYETEGADRTSLELPEGQNKLIAAVAAAQPNTAAVLHNGAPVTMPWIDSVPAVLEMYLAGDGCGEAEVSLLFGAESPSGKLAETFPLRLCDTPAYLTFPGEGRRVEYREGVFTGYRYYDKKEMNVLFPFGHGLSYTSFGYGEPRVSAQEITDAQKLEVSLEITNTGACAGSEAVQLYVRSACECPVKRPVRELRGVCKLALEPGASGRAVFTLAGRDFAYFDTRLGDFAVAGGDYYIDIGSSSRDIRSSVKVRVTPAETIPETFDRSSTVGEALRAPRGREILAGAVAAMGPAEGTEELGAATKIMMQHMFDEMPLIALVHFGGLGYEEVDAIIAKLNSRQ